MAKSSASTLTEAIAAARTGNRLRARELLSSLLRSDSSNAEYWVWMSAVVETKREKIYCLESALKLDPTNRAALRGLAILGARVPAEAEYTKSARIPRRRVSSVAKAPRTRPALNINWMFVGAGASAIVVLFGAGIFLFSLFRPRSFAPAPTLPPISPTPSPTPFIPTATHTLPPVMERVMRTPIPSELALTPIIHFVPETPTLTPVMGATPHRSYEAYGLGFNAFTRGDYATAINYFNQVLDLDPELADVHYLKGECYRLIAANGERESLEEDGDIIAKALSAYDRAVLLNPEYAPAYVGRGRAFLFRLFNTKDIEDLKGEDLPEDFNRALEADPQNAAAYLEKANFYALVRLWKTMEETLQLAIDFGVQDPIIYLRLADAQFNREKFADSLENAMIGSAADPTNLDGYLTLGRAFVQNEEYEEALASLLTYVAYRPEDHRGHAALGRSLLGVGELERAMEHLNRALELYDRYAPAYVARGLLYNELKDGQSALNDFNNARRYGQDSYYLTLGNGEAYYLLGNYTEALKYINSAIEMGNQEPIRANLERKVAEGYALRALIYETNPTLINDAIRNWEWILSFEFASPETRDLAETHLRELTGEVPTRISSPTRPSTNTPTPTRTLTPSVPANTPTPTLTPTPTRTSGPLS